MAEERSVLLEPAPALDAFWQHARFGEMTLRELTGA